MANSVDQDRSSLFWVHAVCFYTLFVSNVSNYLQQTTFSDAIFGGALKVNRYFDNSEELDESHIRCHFMSVCTVC